MTPTELFESFTDFILHYSLLLAGVGILSMAFVEVAKGLFNVRLYYHKFAVNNWLSLYDKQGPKLAADKIPISNELKKLLSGHVVMATEESSEKEKIIAGKLGGVIFGIESSNAFYSLELEQLVAKLQSAFELAIQYPGKYPDMFNIVSSCLSEQDTESWQKHNDVKDTTRLDLSEEKRIFAVLQANLNRQLDILQISIDYAWGRINRFSSMVMGLVLLAGILFYQHWEVLTDENSATGFLIFEIILLSSLGGTMAPFSKNVVKSIYNLRSLKQ